MTNLIKQEVCQNLLFQKNNNKEQFADFYPHIANLKHTLKIVIIKDSSFPL